MTREEAIKQASYDVLVDLYNKEEVVQVTDNYRAALELQKLGLSIYPLASGTKVPLKGSNGSRNATNDYKQICKWWGESPSRNIGLNLADHNLVVLDFDVNHKNGANGWENFLQLKRPLDSTYIEKTPNGGMHFFYRIPKRATIQQQQNAFSEALGMETTGVDVVTTGTPIAPTATDKGTYKAMDSKTFKDVADIPSWVLPMLEKKKPVLFNGNNSQKWRSGQFIDELVKGASVGERNNYIRVICDRMLGMGAELNTIYEILLVANDNFLDEPLSKKEINATFKGRVRNHTRKGA